MNARHCRLRIADSAFTSAISYRQSTMAIGNQQLAISNEIGRVAQW
jgi:hypothetical protein